MASVNNVVVARTPHIYGNFYDAAGYPVFHVEMGNGAEVDMREHEMPKAVHDVLNGYKELVSRVRYNEQEGGWYDVERIITHRVDQQTGHVFFLIAWTGTFAHPIWRQEIAEADVRRDLVRAYRARHHF